MKKLFVMRAVMAITATAVVSACVALADGHTMTKAGDFTCDGTVDARDRMLLARVLDEWDDYAQWQDVLDYADLDGSSAVDWGDYTLLKSVLQKSSGYSLPDTVPTPVPTQQTSPSPAVSGGEIGKQADV